MPTFNDVGGLSRYMKDSLLESAKGIVFEVAEKTIRESIEDNVYSNYVAENVYARTFQLLEIIDISPISVGNSHLRFEIFMNASQLNHATTSVGFNQYESIYGEDVTQNVAHWVEFGHGGLATVEGRHYMKGASTILSNGLLAKTFAQGLRARGFKVTIG